MNVSATGSAVSQAQLAQAQVGASGRRRGQDPLQVAAGALGLSKDDLVAQLKGGKSLDDVAQAQGVSHDDLAAALKAAMPADRRDSADADAMISRMTSRKGLPSRPAGGPGGPGGPRGAGGPGGAPGAGGPGGAGGGGLTAVVSSASTDDDEDDDTSTTSASSTLKALSKLLDMKPADLVDSLTNGTSLADLVTSKGISSQSLAGVVQEGLLVDATA